MKKILFPLLLIISLAAFTTSQESTGSLPTPKSITVMTDSCYICYSTTAYAYHSSTVCRGLNRRTHKIIKVSVDDALRKHKRSLCKICE